VTYQGRDITGNTDLRYKTLSVEKSVENPKHCLYNLDAVEDKENIIVCEGVTDVWKLGKGAVATLGTSTTEEQVRKLSEYDHIHIVFDPEPMAQKRAKRLGEKIAALGTKVDIIDTGLDHDPGEMTAKEVEEFRKELGV
jgi:DNA primase